MSLGNLRFLLLSSIFLFLASPRASAALGFNLGGDTDIVWHHNTLLDNVVWYMYETNYLGLIGTLPKASNVNWQIVATTDFDRDGVTDFLWRDGTTGQNAIWLADITGGIKVYQMITEGDLNYDVVGAGDFNGDGYADILWRHKILELTVAWFMNGTNFSGSVGWMPHMPDRDWGPVAVADCNNDGNADILWRHKTTGENAIWFMDGTNKTTSVAIASMGVTNKLAGTGQFNRIGNTDILWRNTTNGLNSLWSMSGTNYLYTTILPPVTDTNWVIAGTGGYGIPLLLSATPSLSPTSLTVTWRYGSLHGDANTATIFRKTPTAPAWTNLANNYLPLRFTNTDVVVGQRYEYSVGVDGATNYLLTGINVPAVENRGRVLLLVDNTLTNDLDVRRQLANLKTNLVGDGWSVTRHDVARHDDVNYKSNTSNIALNKSLILSFYKSEPTVANLVFIIGHVAIPYSGNFNSDGHPDHFGAWPTDGYYGNTNAISVNGDRRVSWTDSTVNNTNPGYPENVNVTGDGKFDNDYFPTNQAGLSMEMPVGRVDFAKMPAFYNPANGAPRKTESQLLVQYLQKDHRYRNKQTILTDRAVGAGYFGVPLQSTRDPRDEQIYASIVRNGSRLFGVNSGKIFEGDFFKETTSFVLGLQGAAGSYHSMAARDGFGNYVFHISEELALAVNEPKGGFYMLHASYLADWNLSTNNLVRALLATANYGLAAMCNSFTSDHLWYYEPLGLGEPIGVGSLRTINAAGPFASRWMALMGDPTLRAQITSPASSLSGNNGTNITLTWTASPESDVQYYVYRSVNNLEGPWTNLGATSATSFINNPAPPGPKMYQVRVAKLITTGSGSFTNLSQGIFVNLN